MKDNSFVGEDWLELAEHFGIEQKKFPMFDDPLDDEDLDRWMIAESTERVLFVNNQVIKVKVDDEGEFLSIKLKEFFLEQLRDNAGVLPEQVRADMNSFLKALSYKASQHYSACIMYDAMIRMDSDWEFVNWFNRNLETFWY